MRQFKDALGREWTLEVDLPVRRRVKAACDVDLIAVFNGEVFEKLADPEALVNVLWEMCREKAVSRGIDEITFAKGFAGDALEDANNALAGAISDFFPSRQRQLMTKALARGSAEEQKALDQAMEMLNRPDLMTLARQPATTAPSAPPTPPIPTPSEPETTSSGKPTESEASSESTPAA